MSDLYDWIDVRRFVDRSVERALLGLVIAERGLPPLLRDLRPGHFAEPYHRAYWAAIRALHEADPGAPIEPALILSQLERDARRDSGARLDPDAPETLAYLLTVAMLCPGPDLASVYVRRLLNLYNKRLLWAAAVNALKLLHENIHTDALAQDLRRRLVSYVQAIPLTAGQEQADTWAGLDALDAPVEWDWPGWLPRGYLVLLAGEAGIGKSLLALRLAACYLRGDPWPDGRPLGTSGKRAAVLWCESEAAQHLNALRARAWGLPCERIWTPLRPEQDVCLDLEAHRAALSRLAARPEVGLVVVDSLSAASRVSESSDQSLRTVKWLAELARDARKPVLVLHHLRKRGPLEAAGGVGLERLRGHSSIAQPARVVLALDAPDPACPELKRLSVIKSNLAAFPPSLGLTVDTACTGDAGAPQLSFCEPPRPPQAISLLEQAVRELRDLLAQGPLPVTQIHQALDRAGISKRTTHRAKAVLGIRSARQDGHWLWLPPAGLAASPSPNAPLTD